MVQAVVGRVGLLDLAGLEGGSALGGFQDALELFDGGIVGLGVGVEPAVAEQAVVGPVGHECAHGGHRDVVHEEHDDDEDRNAQNAVGDHAIDLLGGRHGLRGLLHALGAHVTDGVVALVGDDGFGVVVLGALERLAHCGDLGQLPGRQVELVDGELLALQKLDGVPAGVAAADARPGDVDHLGEGLLDLLAEAELGRGSRALLRLGDSALHKRVHAAALKGGGFHHRAAQMARELGHVDGVAVLLHEIHHVQSQNHRNAQVDDLGGEIQVTFQIGGVHQVDDHVGLAAHEVVAGDDLLGGVGRQRVYAGQVGDNHLFVAAVLALFLLNGNAGPVSHVLVGTGQIVEHGRLAAVGIAGKGDVDCHGQPFLLLGLRFRFSPTLSQTSAEPAKLV